MKLELSEIVIDESIYPRVQVNWQKMLEYKDSMALRGEFAPVVVAKRDGKYVLLDGRHRHGAAKGLGWTAITALVSKAKPEDFFAESVRLNTENRALSLTVQERTAAAQRLLNEGRKIDEIQHLLSVPAAKLEKWIQDRVVFSKDSDVPFVLKSVLSKAGKTPASESDQKSLTGQDQGHLLFQVIVLLENDLIADDEETQKLVDRLATALAAFRARVPA